MAEIIEMPKLSDTMTTGTLVKWLKKEGDALASGDMIAEVETDKATMEVENFEDGVLLKLYVQEGDAVAIGSPICAVGEEGETAPEVEAAPAEPEPESESKPEADAEEPAESSTTEPQAEASESSPPESAPATAEAPQASASAPFPANGERVKASPLARKLAEELGINLSTVSGTGPSGRIVKADVELAAKNPRPVQAAAAAAFVPGRLEEKTEKVTNMRASIAKALVKSKVEAPHFYLQCEVDAAALSTLRQDLNGFLAALPLEEGGVKLTVNDLILRAAAMAAVKVPAINRTWLGASIRQNGSVHLAFGVAIDDGLVTPVIRDAHTKSLRQIAGEARALIAKARDRKLKPEEMSGSTLTVTNLGMFGISDFYGIINPGNAAILSVGATSKQPVVDANDNISIGYRMKIGLSGDHRVIDGAVAAQYLSALRELLEKPGILLA
jgi:pyruvate dehydrogenase E2 component (dihydrolipoamide acetyltransferase)